MRISLFFQNAEWLKQSFMTSWKHCRRLRHGLAIMLVGCTIARGQTGTMPNTDERGASLPITPATSDQSLSELIGNRDAMEHFIDANPTSPRSTGLRNAIAKGDRLAGRITPALNRWKEVWQQSKNSSDAASYAEANHALAGQLELLSSLGRVESLRDLLKAAETRSVTDPEDRRRIEAAREAYAIMSDYPGLNYRCGTLALAEIARIQGKPEAVINALVEEPSPSNGLSLATLARLSKQYRLGLVAVKRTDTSPLPTPCIVHWSQNHFGALLEYRADLGCYRAIFGDPHWISAADTDAEASGYFLVPENQRPPSWPIVPESESSQVIGRSYIYSIKDANDKGCKKDPVKPKTTCVPCEKNKTQPKGMPEWWVSEPYINLWLADEPVSYTTSQGEDFAFRITVKQRDTTGNFYAYPRPGFLHNWYSRINIQGMPLMITQYLTNGQGQVTTTNVPVASTNSFSSWTATVDLPTGGQVSYDSSSLYDEASKTQLRPSYGVLSDGTSYVVPGLPLGGNNAMPDATTFLQGNSSESGFAYWNDGASGFRIFYPDGSTDRYGLIYWRTNAAAGFYECEALLTQRSDPIGNDVNLTYELYTNQSSAVYFRLKQVVDYDGKTNKFTYSPSNPGLLQQVTTPYNQTAIFSYDSQTNLASIVDAVSLTNSLIWNANGQVTALITPYGTNQFFYYEIPITDTNRSGGHDRVNRAITAVDANGGTNIYLYRFDCSGTMSPDIAAGDRPGGTPLGTLDFGTNSASASYAAISFRNSFHWDTRQSATLSSSSVTNLTAGDYLKAHWSHWLGDTNNTTVLDQISMEREPSPDGTTEGQKTFYDYPGKTLSYLQGTNSQIAIVARLQPSGNTEYTWSQYNPFGYLTKEISTYTLADGVLRTRTNSIIYATNTITFTLNNNAPNTPAGTVLLYINDGDFNNNGYPAYPLIAAYELLGKCGAWSVNNAGTSTYSTANLPVAFIDAMGNTTRYGGYPQISKTTTAHAYTAWWYSSMYWSADWNQRIVKTYTAPLPTKITNAVDYVTSITYNSDNQVTSIRTPAGLTTTNRYDANGFLTNVTDLQISRTNSFTYTNGLIYTWQNERGLRITNVWDKLQRLVKQADQEGYVSNIYTRLDLTGTRDRLGNWTYFGYDPLRHLVAATNANQEVSLASYCSCGALEWTRDPLTNYTHFTYDLAGRLTSTLYPDGYAVTNTYNAIDQLLRTSDPLGQITNTYNLQGLATSATAAFGTIRSTGYDILDRPQSVTDNRGVTSAVIYDGIDRITTNVIVGILTNSFVYSTNGLIQAADGLRTNLTNFRNDPLERVLLRTNANGEAIQFQYDPSGNLTNMVDGRLQRTIFQFDSFNRLTNKLDNNLTSLLKLAYDANSWVQSRWTPEKGTIVFVRDLVGRVRTNSYPSNPQVIFSYDSAGQLTTMSDGLGTTTFTYSPTGQPRTESGLWANDTVNRSYNNRLRSSLILGSWNTTYGFDSAHRLRSLVSGSGAFQYTYHPGLSGSFSSSLVQSISLPNGMTITNGFDSAARLTATTLLNSQLSAVNFHSYGYDANGRRTSQTRYDNSSINYTYDPVGQLKAAIAKESNGTPRLNEQFGYNYDPAGNLNYRTNNTLTLIFGINSLNELTNSTRTGTFTVAGTVAGTPSSSPTVNDQPTALYGDKSFATTSGLALTNGLNTFAAIVQYSDGHNLTNVTISQLPTPVMFSYDLNGNLTNDGLRSFVYDDENQLVNINVAGQWKTEFSYDGLGRRRITRDYSWNGTWNLTNEIHYIYDLSLVIQERDSNNIPLVTYTRGLDLSGRGVQEAGGIGGLLARKDRKGSVFYHGDGAGNITALVDPNQTLEARYLYDPYGNMIGKWGPMADINRYQFATRERHISSGLYYFGLRFYDPNLQRWLNRDPIQESGGINLFGYVGNDPINNIDLYGLSQEGAEASFGETSSLYPQLIALPKGQVHQPADVYRDKNWDPKSYKDLQDARQYIADIRERNKQTRRQDASKSTNSIVKKAWKDCEDAAKKAEGSDLPKGFDHFSLRQGPIIPGQNNGSKPGFVPDWSAGMIHYQEGPFINNGGGDVPKGPDTYIDFWQTPPPPKPASAQKKK